MTFAISQFSPESTFLSAALAALTPLGPSEGSYTGYSIGSEIDPIRVTCSYISATNAPEEVTVEYDPHLYVATYFEYWDEIELTLYNPRESLTGKIVSCNQDFCKEIGGGLRGCAANTSCLYTEVYGDGSYSMGYFVEDVVHSNLDMNVNACGLNLQQFLFGELGVWLQLASAGRVKKMFAHCLDGVNGGGIFAIGHVVQPLVNTTPLVPGQQHPAMIFVLGVLYKYWIKRLHYNVNMTAVQVDHAFLNLTTDVYAIVNKKGVIIDSGTTLAYLPKAIYYPLVKQILSWQMDLKLKTLHDQYTCFDYSGSFPNLDDPGSSFDLTSMLNLPASFHYYSKVFFDD
ncbi:aspartic proteinase-like protein 2 [Phtheirospermum japonicum]|uniref:Aspartic proteinase-like protein 2 n=1 Tax=Phtheirospermum japonicum TaxID=374723 RepID=A0A830CAD3_9LAMI|nr:aspartic proteinase-like protein 2 [Phtheirospermum japonicum]